MDYYYISRKTAEGDEYLRITNSGKHVWWPSSARATLLPKSKADAKVRNLRLYGRKEFFYRPHYAYFIQDVFIKDALEG
jgi:hypothetical protein